MKVYELIIMEELTKIVESNAKAIAALTSDIQEMKRDKPSAWRHEVSPLGLRYAI